MYMYMDTTRVVRREKEIFRSIFPLCHERFKHYLGIQASSSFPFVVSKTSFR